VLVIYFFSNGKLGKDKGKSRVKKPESQSFDELSEKLKSEIDECKIFVPEEDSGEIEEQKTTGARGRSIKSTGTLDKNPNINMGSIWKSLILGIEKNGLVQDKIDEEKTLLIKTVLEFKKLKVLGAHKEHKITGDALIEKMIKYVVRGNESGYNQNTMINVVKLLTKTVNMYEDEPKKKEEIQDYLNNLGAMQMILIILSNDQSGVNNELLDSLLDLGCALLDGGRLEVQKTVFRY
jgi:hypothetical protein